MPFITRGEYNIFSPIVTGGIEKMQKDIWEIYKDILIPIEITKEDRQNKKTKQIFLDAVAYHEPDIILIHDNDAYFTIPQIKMGIPTIWFFHGSLVKHIRFINLFQQIQDFHNAGGHFYCVSENQLNFFNEFSQRIINKPLPPINGFIRPSYATTTILPAEETKYDVITIGRSNKYKDPFYIHRMLENTGLITAVSTGDNRNFLEDEVDYYNKNIHWQPPQYTFRNLRHEDNLIKLSESKVYISTQTNESFGITVLEALSCGVPCILLTDKTNKHSSEIIAADSTHIKKIYKNASKEELLSVIKEFTNLDYYARVDISNATKEKHSFVNFKNMLNTIFEKRKTTKPTINNLNQFFI